MSDTERPPEDPDTPPSTPVDSVPVEPAPVVAAAPVRRRRSWLALLLFVLLAAAAGAALWMQQLALRESNARGDDWRTESESLQARIGELDNRLQRIEAALQQQERRITEASSTQRVVRDEMLAVGMRASAIEEAVARLAQGRTRADTAMRLNEVEFLLLQASQLLQLGDNVDAATSALELAAEALQGVDDASYRLLEESLAQELVLLEGLPADPLPRLRARLQVVIDRLDRLPAPPRQEASAVPADAPRWQQLLDRLVTVRRVDATVQIAEPEQRQAGLMLLRLQLERALAALQRREADDFTAILQDARDLLARLTDLDDPQAQAIDAELAEMAEIEALQRPRVQLGRTLRELQAMRSIREQARDRFPAETPAPAAGGDRPMPTGDDDASEADPVQADPAQ